MLTKLLGGDVILAGMIAVCMVASVVVERTTGEILASTVTRATRAMPPWCWVLLRLVVKVVERMLCVTIVASVVISNVTVGS